MALSCNRGSSGWLLGNSSSEQQSGTGTAAQGGDGITVPGGVNNHRDVALRNVVSRHGEMSSGPQRFLPTLVILR